MRRLRLGILFLTVGLAGTARAQIGVAASISAQDLNQDNGNESSWLYGPTFSVQDERGHVLKLGGDLRGTFVRRNGVGVDSITIGPRVSVATRPLPFKPYGEFLVGGLGVRSNTGAKFTTHVEYQFVVGMDMAVLPHLDWRVLEYSYGRVVNSGEDRRNTLSTGIVLRFF